MNLFKSILILNSTSFLLAVCPSGFYEDDCGNCWLPYCYDYISHNMSYDSSEASCNGPTEMWVIPGEQGDPFFNNYCNSCPDGFTPDSCGLCWQDYCYTLFAYPQHTVFWDLNESECIEAGYGYYTAGASEADPYFGYNCNECIVGDVNNDVTVDILDIVALVGYILGNNLLESEIECADYISDNSIDVLDIVAMVNFVLNS